jgi:hypothetical protein
MLFESAIILGKLAIGLTVCCSIISGNTSIVNNAIALPVVVASLGNSIVTFAFFLIPQDSGYCNSSVSPPPSSLTLLIHSLDFILYQFEIGSCISTQISEIKKIKYYNN